MEILELSKLLAFSNFLIFFWNPEIRRNWAFGSGRIYNFFYQKCFSVKQALYFAREICERVEFQNYCPTTFN